MQQLYRVVAVGVVFALAMLPASALAQGPDIVSVQPTQNASNVASSSDISVTFDSDMDAATINSGTFVVNTRTTGLQTGTYGYDAGTRTAWFDPDTDFKPGEVVSVTLTTGVTAQGVPLSASFSWTFTVVVETGVGALVWTDTYPLLESSSHAVSTADLNGDGYPDLLVINRKHNTANDLSVHLNNGDGTFRPGVPYEAGNMVEVSSAADLNGDGFSELIVVSGYYPWTGICIMDNNGDGTFAPPELHSVGGSPRGTAVADYNGDGHLDVATACYDGGHVAVLLNDANGGLSPFTPYSVDGTPTSVVTADLNSDGFMDLAATIGSGEVAILLNDGTGEFSPRVQYPVDGSGILGLVTADLNHDGHMDLVSAATTGYTQSVMLNNGLGVFSTYTVLYPSRRTHHLLACDLHASGHQDILYAERHNPGAHGVMANNGDGTFELCARYPTGNTTPTWVAVADFDGDGDLDVVTTDGSDFVSISFNVEGHPCPLLSFPEKGDDATTSLGTFVVLVKQQFRSLFADYLGYDPSNYNLRSPILEDEGTIIGRSDMHHHGDPDDATGVPTGEADITVGDNDFTLVPEGFQGPAGTEEIHTEIHSLNMTHVSGAAVRAGTHAPSRTRSFGEIESVPGNLYGLPGQSFFNVFVEVDIPENLSNPWGAGMIVANEDPLLVRAENLLVLPPRVVYIHDNSSAVPVVLQNSNPPLWESGDVMGYLVLAGHGVNMTMADSALFDTIIDTLPEMPPPYMEIGIDIKPFSCPNPLNIKSHGVTSHHSDTITPGVSKVQPGGFDKPKALLPAAVLGSADLDVTEIDPTTVTLAGVSAYRWSFEDVATPNLDDAEPCECNTIGSDGYTDLTLKFDKSAVIDALGEVGNGDVIPLTLSGELTDGSAFEGVDCVVIRAGGPGEEPGSSSALDRPTLIGNFPNPFNPTTEFNFYLPQTT
ncbi:MAG: FG-GAP-like repeat-containing protein, partial [candidate division Zixibacteria bacterium]|nr:FG-GAP-like repeat-containing protein [candidate division Zixibacteria bacterium]